ncbi:MAG: hypothetical protein ABIF87_02495 [Pseudomonadota bacterium]
MDKLTHLERELLELTRKHIQNEKELIARFEGSKLEPINLKTKKEWVNANFEIEERIRELLGEITESLNIQDPPVRNQLKKIRDMKSKTRKYTADIEFSELAITLGISESRLQKLFGNEMFWEKVKDEILTAIPSANFELEEEEKIRETQELDEMIEYLQGIVGYSGDFHERRKKFGTVIVDRSLPPTGDIFLREIKDFFLLNQFEAVIGFSRILLEIVCQSIFDGIPANIKNNFRRIDGEFGARQKIREACKYRLRSLNKSKNEINQIKNLAEKKYGEASDVLHGKLPPLSEGETLNFVMDVFSVIEALYSNR